MTNPYEVLRVSPEAHSAWRRPCAIYHPDRSRRFLMLAFALGLLLFSVASCGSTEKVSCQRNFAGTTASCEKSSKSSIESWMGDATDWLGGHLLFVGVGLALVCSAILSAQESKGSTPQQKPKSRLSTTKEVAPVDDKRSRPSTTKRLARSLSGALTERKRRSSTRRSKSTRRLRALRQQWVAESRPTKARADLVQPGDSVKIVGGQFQVVHSVHVHSNGSTTVWFQDGRLVTYSRGTTITKVG